MSFYLLSKGGGPSLAMVEDSRREPLNVVESQDSTVINLPYQDNLIVEICQFKDMTNITFLRRGG